MNLTNYHSHCSYCDGRAPLEQFIQEAIRQGFTSYGISSHAPLPFHTHWSMDREQLPAYLEECNRIKEKYRNDIELYIGMEIDFLNEESNPSVSRFQDLPLDYRIGSVHLLYDKQGELVDVDCSADRYHILVDKHFDGDIQYIVETYFARLLRMVELGGFDILGHADKMHYNASVYHPGLLDATWYNDIIQDYFKEIAARNYIVEINTKAYHKWGTFFPNKKYFSLLLESGIPVQVNSDAHYPELINDGRPEALKALKETGFTHVMEMHDGKWVSTVISE